MNATFPIGIAAITVLVFARLIGCQFTVWDDAGTIFQNPYLNPPTWHGVAYYWTTLGKDTPGQLYTPVTYTVWSAIAAMSDAIFGRAPDIDGIRLSPALFHGTNVLLHAVTAALVYELLWRLFGRRWPAAAGALLFAVHPVQVESVGWASGTKDVLCGLFAVAALLAYARAVQVAAAGGQRAAVRWRYALATACLLLAMFSKPTALMVPPMAALLDGLVLARPWRRVVRWLWPWAVLMIPCVLWTRAAQSAPWAAPIPAWAHPLVATDAIAFYLWQVARPAHLCVDYGRRPVAVVASGAIYYTWLLPAAVALVLAWGWRRGARVPVAAAGLFVLPLVPLLGFVPFDFEFYSTVADHYLYLPMLGVAVLAAWAMPRLPRRLVVPGTVLLLVGLAARSVLQEPTWHDTGTIFANVLQVNPQSFVACDMMGYVDSQAARRLRRGRPGVPPTDPNYNLWRAYLEDSLVWYQRALERYGAHVPSLVNIAINTGQLGLHDQQRAALRRVVALQPTLPESLRADPLELARRMIDAGDPAGAAAFLDGVVRADPSDLPAAQLRSQALAAARR